MKYFKCLSVLPPEGGQANPLLNINSALKDANCLASDLKMATAWDSFYKATVIIITNDPHFFFDKVSLANAARLFMRELHEDTDPLYRCGSCGQLYYQSEVMKNIRKSLWSREKTTIYPCIQTGCMGECREK